MLSILAEDSTVACLARYVTAALFASQRKSLPSEYLGTQALRICNDGITRRLAFAKLIPCLFMTQGRRRKCPHLHLALLGFLASFLIHASKTSA